MKRLLSNDDFIDGFLTATTIITILLLLLFSIPVSAQLPETGSLGIKSDGVGTDRSISLAVDGNETGTKNLLDLCATAGVSPCSILAFRGWPDTSPISNCVLTENYPNGFNVSWNVTGSTTGYSYTCASLLRNGVSVSTKCFPIGTTATTWDAGPNIVVGDRYVAEIKLSTSIGGTPSYSLPCFTAEVVYGANVPPGVPRNFTASKQDILWGLSWLAPSTGGPVSLYRIEVEVDNSGTWFAARTTSELSTTYPGLPGNSYKFRIRAENAGGVSDWVEHNAGPF